MPSPMNDPECPKEKTLLERVLEEISRASPNNQLLVAVASGWVSGFLAMRLGRAAALALGGGIILLQVANDKEYIKINWSKIDKNIKKDKIKIQPPQATSKLIEFSRKNTAFSSGFIGGFLIGLASH